MSPIEVTASDVETAIEQGLQRLGLMRAEVHIEILDEGSRGVLGLGGRPARVRLTPFAEVASGESVAAPSQARADAERTHTHAAGDQVRVPPPKIEGEELALALARGLLERMGFGRAQVTVRSVFPSHPDDEPYLWLDITMDKRDAALFTEQDDVLPALQFVLQTLWSHQTRSSLRVNVDVNGVRARRERQLTNMAQRLAEKVAASGQPIELEPMPAVERRIIHVALRDHAQVYTESTGEGEARRVQIKPRTPRA
ncbi:MAG: Jag N-terminal domain-containing protein [Thermoflexales bacterium]|nr:Jag N-terminal domain-containing protein [Thermoflexales bacterium]